MKDKKIYFEKILKYVKTARKITQGITFDEFVQNDEKTQACAFSILQIAEYASRFEEGEKEKYSTIEWTNIRAIRNRIVHDYGNIDLKIVWNVIKDHLPKMEQNIQGIIDSKTI
ncbi:MAG: DUF86 domain-containing protein [Firmicutes bacterium]|nr:DUF86 domain-containing protein [Bacillota bacterium]